MQFNNKPEGNKAYWIKRMKTDELICGENVGDNNLSLS